MTVSKKKIGISLRIVNAPNYKEKRDALSHDWPSFLIGIGYHPVLIPNAIPEINSFLRESELEGLILSGGDNIGDTPERDITENKIISFAISNKIPIFGKFGYMFPALFEDLIFIFPWIFLNMLNYILY